MAGVSIVVPSYNSRETIESCLKSLLAQKHELDCEVILVDSSSDGTAEFVSKTFPQVKLIAMPERVLSGKARNIGVSASVGEYILFIDSDCVAGNSWVEDMLAAHSQGDFAAVGGSVLNANPESLVAWASYITEFSEYMPVGPVRERISAPTCNICYRRRVFEKHAGFDETLRMYVDYEFNSRLRSYGERLLFVPHIRVRHHHRTSIGSYAKHELQRGRAAVMLRRSGLLPGGWAVRSRLLCSLVAPAMMARRAMADIGRFVSSGMVPTGKLAAVAPSFAIGTICWGAGFLIEGLKPDYLRIDRNHRGPSFRTK